MAIDWLNRLGKWRTILTGRLVGTKAITDPTAIALRDVFDKMNILAAEANALQTLTLDLGIFSAEDLQSMLEIRNAAAKAGTVELFSTLLKLRAQVTAVTDILIRSGAFGAERYRAQVHIESELLCECYEATFPGIQATDDGLSMKPLVVAKYMKEWPR